MRPVASADRPAVPSQDVERSDGRRGPFDEPAALTFTDLGIVSALVLALALLRVDLLGPSSLWLDDAWVALAHRAESWTELRYTGLTSPGFAVLLKSWLALVGFSETNAQLLPFLGGVTAPGLMYVVARRIHFDRIPSLAGAAVVGLAPMVVTYTTRVKQFTLESLIALGLLLLGIRLIRQTTVRATVGFALAAGLSVTFSPFLVLYVPAIIVTAAWKAWKRDDYPFLRSLTLSTAILGGFTLAWYLFILKPAVNTKFVNYWKDYYLNFGDGFAPAWASLAKTATRFAGGFIELDRLGPAFVPLLFSLLLISVLAIAIHKPSLAVILVTPIFLGVAISAVGVAPLGGGRTDVYLYPSLALILSGGLNRLRVVLERRRTDLPLGSAVIAAMVATFAVISLIDARTPRYPKEDLRPLVAELETSRRSDDALLIYPYASFGFALYTSESFDMVPDTSLEMGFVPDFRDPLTYVLPMGRHDPAAYSPMVDRASASDRVWLIASHWRNRDYEYLKNLLSNSGFKPVNQLDRPGAELILWVRAD